MHQLIYTSAPRLLDPGKTGFGTLICTKGMPGTLISFLERISAFDRGAGVDALECYTTHKMGRYVFHIFSRIGDCGADYTGRTNHVAHHFVIEEGTPEAQTLMQYHTPASVLAGLEPVWVTTCPSAPERIDERYVQIPPITQTSSAWAELTGSPVKARWMASLPYGSACCLLFPCVAQIPLCLRVLHEGYLCKSQKGWGCGFSTALVSTISSNIISVYCLDARQDAAGVKPSMSLPKLELSPSLGMPPGSAKLQARSAPSTRLGGDLPPTSNVPPNIEKLPPPPDTLPIPGGPPVLPREGAGKTDTTIRDGEKRRRQEEEKKKSRVMLVAAIAVCGILAIVWYVLPLKDSKDSGTDEPTKQVRTEKTGGVKEPDRGGKTDGVKESSSGGKTDGVKEPDRGGKTDGVKESSSGGKTDGVKEPDRGGKTDGVKESSSGGKTDGVKESSSGGETDGVKESSSGGETDGVKEPDRGGKTDGVKESSSGGKTDGVKESSSGGKTDGVKEPDRGGKTDGVKGLGSGDDTVTTKDPKHLTLKNDDKRGVTISERVGWNKRGFRCAVEGRLDRTHIVGMVGYKQDSGWVLEFNGKRWDKECKVKVLTADVPIGTLPANLQSDIRALEELDKTKEDAWNQLRNRAMSLDKLTAYTSVTDLINEEFKKKGESEELSGLLDQMNREVGGQDSKIKNALQNLKDAIQGYDNALERKKSKNAFVGGEVRRYLQEQYVPHAKVSLTYNVKTTDGAATIVTIKAELDLGEEGKKDEQ